MKKEYYTIKELAEALGMSRQGIYLKVKRGQIETVQIGEHLRLITKSEFQRWVKHYRPYMHFSKFSNRYKRVKKG